MSVPSVEPASARLVFVLPKRIAGATTGGNLYNRGLMQALARETGHEPAVLEPARAGDLLATGTLAIVLVDSLLLGDVPRLVRLRGPEQRVVVLGHSLPSLMSDAPVERIRALIRDEQRDLTGIDGVIAPSTLAARMYAERAGHARICAVPPAVDLDPPADPVEPPPADHPLHCLMLSNLVANKGIAELLACLANRVCEDDRLWLDIAGHTDLEPAYAARCRQIIAGSPALARTVRLCGVLPRQEVRARLMAADALVSASIFESFGMALHEARAFGLHLIARPGGNSSAHMDEGGVLGHGPDELADAVIALGRDHARLDHLRRSRRHRPEMFDRTWMHVAREVVDALRMM